MAAMRYVVHFALLVTTIGMKEVLDSNSFLQLDTESRAALDASGGEEVAPVEEIAKAAIDLLNEHEKQETEILKEREKQETEILKEREKQETEILKEIIEMKKNEVHEEGHESTVRGHASGEGGAGNGSAIEMEGTEVGEEDEARGAAARSTRAVQHVAHGRVLGDINRSDPRVLGNHDSSDPWATGTVASLDLAAADTALKGFKGGFTDGTYGYTLPYWYEAYSYSGKVARFDLAGFATTEVLDLAAVDPALKGFFGGFTDGTYGYAIPYNNGGINYGKVARFDLAGFATTEALDLEDVDPDLRGFFGGFTDGTYGYAIPHHNGQRSGKLARFDLAGFATTEVLDLKAADPALGGFLGGFTDGTYGYVVPYYNGASVTGKVGRFDLAGFATTEALDLAAVDPALKGFQGGFTDGTYGYFVPYYLHPTYSGKVARFDLAGFATTEALDLAAVDPALKGFTGGFTDGTYGYAIPYYNGATYSGKVARFDLAGFATTEALDLATADPALKGFDGGFTDGTYGYAIPYYNGAAYSGKVARFGVMKHVPLDFSGANPGPDQSSVVGDPHVVSVAKARFEIRAAGAHKLVQIPRSIRANGKPDLRVDAKIEHLVGNDCSKSFMTSLTIFGRWTEEAALGLMHISQGSDMPNTTLLVNTQDPEAFFHMFPLPDVKAGRASLAFKVKGVGFHVGKHFEGRYGKQRAYLNVRITGLKQYKDLGGLLGYDGHADAEKPDANCTAAQPAVEDRSSFISTQRSAPSTDGGSRIEAE